MGAEPTFLEKLLPEIPEGPGVYRFLDANQRVLYVGKAKNLKKRVASYRVAKNQTPKTGVMLRQARDLEVVITATESEALILEANLIKSFQPRYNILLTDDKSYPYLLLDDKHPFPRLALYRGARKKGGTYFGPYPTIQAVRETLRLLQKIFPVRQCKDSQFANRERPCLQYQIKRCSGPCCDKVEPERYGEWVREVTLFLQGKDKQVEKQLKEKMWTASQALDFEEAARLRDRIDAIRKVQEARRVELSGGQTGHHLDVAGLSLSGSAAAVQVFFIRGGLNLGARVFYPENTEGETSERILGAFLEQFYADKPPPPEIVLNLPAAGERGWLASVLAEKRGGPVNIRVARRGAKKRIVDLAAANAASALARRLSAEAGDRERLQALGELLGLPALPERVEVYDVSHTGDQDVVAGMIVVGPEGFRKNAYRRFTIKAGGADDTARMAEVLSRRFERLKKEEGKEGDWPDLILLDGGRGQLNAVVAAAEEAQVDGVRLCAIAKGPDRHAGKERLFLPGEQAPLILPEDSPILFLLQKIRDEAHRFAVGFHRVKRAKRQRGSVLDAIPGIGPKRKRELLRHFGSAAAVGRANVEEIQKVVVSRPLAEAVARAFKE